MKDIHRGKDRRRSYSTEKIDNTDNFAPKTKLGKDLMAIHQEILKSGETESEEEIQQYMDSQRRRYLLDSY